MDDHADARLVEILHRLGLTEAMVRDHVMRPEHVTSAAMRIELRRPGDAEDETGDAPPPSGLFYRLSIEGLGRSLHTLLSGCLSGYSLQLRRYGRTLLDQQWNWSRTPVDGGVAWTADVLMHVASVSKLITAMAMTRLLHSHGISPDARLSPWLPKYWHKGTGVDQLTFRHLLTHTSGLVLLDQAGPSDFQFMKDQIAIGTVGKAGYRNLNFGLCRILISTIDAPYLFNMIGPGATDAYWDLTTIRYYSRYVNEHVFAPAGVASTLDHTWANALAYPYPANEPGRNSGDLSTMSGCVAWHLSVDDLLRVMAAFRRRGFIVDPVRAERMLNRQFGLDVKKDTPLGRIYGKGGFWSFDGGRFVEQTNVFFLPKGMELAILANSPHCTPDTGFMGKVLKAIEDNIESTLFSYVIAAAGAIVVAGVYRKIRAKRL